MKRYVLVLASVIAVGARANTPILENDALNEFDVPVSTGDLTLAFGSNQIDSGLTGYVNSTTTQPSVRVRAISALATYCEENGCKGDARLTVLNVVGTPEYNMAQSGSDLLVFRAALESLGSVGDQFADWQIIAGNLSHPSRDIRTSAARALKNLQAACAVQALRTRYQDEPTDQVRSAITDALSLLTTLPVPPPSSCN